VAALDESRVGYGWGRIREGRRSNSSQAASDLTSWGALRSEGTPPTRERGVHMANIVRAAIVQTEWTGDKESMIDKHEVRPPGRRAGRPGDVLPGAVQRRLLLPGAGGRPHGRRRADPRRADHPADEALAKETGWCWWCPSTRRRTTASSTTPPRSSTRDGTYLGKYRKTHIPHVGGFWEKFYFRPGNMGYPIFDTSVGRIGVYICYDRHFPEGWRALGLAGAKIVFNPSATSRGLSMYLWNLEQPAAAVANEYFIGAINRVGKEPYGDNDFYGSSYFVEPARPDRRRAGVRHRRGAGGARPRHGHARRGPQGVGLLPGSPTRRLRPPRRPLTRPT
jgi:beta-ureidopropionase